MKGSFKKASGTVSACFSLTRANRWPDQLPKRPVMQSHEITLSFHREMADLSRELVEPDITVAATLSVIHASSKAVSRITRVSGSKIHCQFQACSLPTIEVARKQRVLESSPKVVEIFGINWNFGRSLQIEGPRPAFQSGARFLSPVPLPAAMRKAPISTSATCPPEGRLGSCLTNTRPVTTHRSPLGLR